MTAPPLAEIRARHERDTLYVKYSGHGGAEEKHADRDALLALVDALAGALKKIVEATDDPADPWEGVVAAHQFAFAALALVEGPAQGASDARA